MKFFKIFKNKLLTCEYCGAKFYNKKYCPNCGRGMC